MASLVRLVVDVLSLAVPWIVALFFWYLVPFIAALLVAFSMDSVTTFVQLAVILGLTNVAGLEVALVG